MNATTSIENTQANTGFDAATLRASTYSLLARLLRQVPDAELLALLGQVETSAQPRNSLEHSWHQLKLSAAQAQLEALDDEFHTLFIGLGHGEVIPYGSWYQTGYLMDKPLARLRYDLSQLGLERQDQISEPEDHIAAVCECMALLIDNGADLTTQQEFFRDHLHSWLARCFIDIEQAPSARFYQAVGQLGQRFVELETQYLDLLDIQTPDSGRQGVDT
jgi:TorA maturation chaperone TorD